MTVSSRIRVLVVAVIALLSLGGAPAHSESFPLSDSAPRAFHIDCARKSAGTGSLAHPWNRLAAANAHVFTPGDSLLLKRGTACNGQLAPSGSGTSSARVTLASYGKGVAPRINGRGTPNGTGALQLVNLQYWTVSDLRITNSTVTKRPRTYRSGVLILNTGVGRLSGITVRDLIVESVRSNPADGELGPRDWGGISALTYGGDDDGFDDLRIAGNAVADVSRTGIVVSNHQYPASQDRNTRVDHNVVLRARGDGILVLGTKKGRIDHNTARQNGDILPCPECGPSTRGTASVGIWTTRSDRVLIEHNEASGQYAEAGDGEGFDIDNSATNVVLQYNYSHDNDGGGVFLCGAVNAVVRFNIFEDNGKSQIAFIGTVPAKNTSIYNNTFYTSKAADAGNVRYFNGPKGDGIHFFNNIVYNYARGYYLWPTKVTSRSNTYLGVKKPGEPHGAGWSRRAPGLKDPGSGKAGFASVKGYKPIDAVTFKRGVAIPKTVTRDFFGKKINPKHPPRGAAG